MKVFVEAGVDYLCGYLRYGHYEGELEIPEEDAEIFKNDPMGYIEDNQLQYDLKLVADDYSVEDVGTIYEVSYKEI